MVLMGDGDGEAGSCVPDGSVAGISVVGSSEADGGGAGGGGAGGGGAGGGEAGSEASRHCDGSMFVYESLLYVEEGDLAPLSCRMTCLLAMVAALLLAWLASM
jgi:hypothetical protein